MMRKPKTRFQVKWAGSTGVLSSSESSSSDSESFTPHATSYPSTLQLKLTKTATGWRSLVRHVQEGRGQFLDQRAFGHKTKIYVGNISDSCKAEDLRVLFAKYGAVEDCDVVQNFGFVHMSDEDESKVAIDALNGSEFMGVKITVEASNSKVRPKAGMGGKGQCYRCGKSGHRSKECPRNSYERNGSPSHNDNYGRGPPIPGPPPMPYGPDRGYNGSDRGRRGERALGNVLAAHPDLRDDPCTEQLIVPKRKRTVLNDDSSDDETSNQLQSVPAQSSLDNYKCVVVQKVVGPAKEMHDVHVLRNGSRGRPIEICPATETTGTTALKEQYENRIRVSLTPRSQDKFAQRFQYECNGYSICVACSKVFHNSSNLYRHSDLRHNVRVYEYSFKVLKPCYVLLERLNQ